MTTATAFDLLSAEQDQLKGRFITYGIDGSTTHINTIEDRPYIDKPRVTILFANVLTGHYYVEQFPWDTEAWRLDNGDIVFKGASPGTEWRISAEEPRRDVYIMTM